MRSFRRCVGGVAGPTDGARRRRAGEGRAAEVFDVLSKRDRDISKFAQLEFKHGSLNTAKSSTASPQRVLGVRHAS